MNEDTQKPIVNLPPKQLNIEPITLHEVDDEITKRISRIEQEFKRGFDFIKGQPKTVTFFGSARFPEDNEHYQRARRIAYKLAKEGFSIVSGGGPGIMEAANRGAFEAEGRSLGLNIKLPMEQVRNPYLTDTVDFYYFFTRKVAMTFSAEAYLIFPGGFGTFDECFEILTLVQTNKIEKLPIVLVGESFWKPFVDVMRQVMYVENKAIDEADLNMFIVSDDEDRIVDIVKAAPIRTGVRTKPVDQNGGTQA